MAHVWYRLVRVRGKAQIQEANPTCTEWKPKEKTTTTDWFQGREIQIAPVYQETKVKAYCRNYNNRKHIAVLITNTCPVVRPYLEKG